MLVRDKLGICQWFHHEDRDTLERSLALMDDLGVRHLRTGISWPDYHRPGGKRWTARQMHAFRDAGLDVLACVAYTPPSISEGGSSNSPPKDLKAYADFIDVLITEYGDCFSGIEIWNEPNSRQHWDFRRYDPEWRKYARMATLAGNWIRERGKTSVLGGMVHLDMYWVGYMLDHGVFGHVDAVGSHGFPFMWEPHATDWDYPGHWYGGGDVPEELQGRPRRIAKISGMSGRPVWITETGLATYDKETGKRYRYDLQSRMLEQDAAAPCERAYWYTLIDLDPAREAIEEHCGDPREEAEYHLGLVTHDGQKKPAYRTMRRLLRSPARISPDRSLSVPSRIHR